MAVDTGLPSGAVVSEPVERRVSKKAAKASERRSEVPLLAVYCLVQVLWIASWLTAYGKHKCSFGVCSRADSQMMRRGRRRLYVAARGHGC